MQVVEVSVIALGMNTALAMMGTGVAPVVITMGFAPTIKEVKDTLPLVFTATFVVARAATKAVPEPNRYEAFEVAAMPVKIGPVETAPVIVREPRQTKSPLEVKRAFVARPPPDATNENGPKIKVAAVEDKSSLALPPACDIAN